MDLSLSDEEREIRDWVRTFVTREIMPLESTVLERERRNERGLTREELRGLRDKAKESGFFGVQTPEEYGGMALGAVMTALIEAELGRSFVPFSFGGDADNILYSANDEQQERYLLPTINGDKISCFAITEPGAGSDARNIRTSAVRDGDEWVINGEKTFITFGDVADFVMVFAVTDKEKGANGGRHLLPGRPRGRLDLGADPDDGSVGSGVAELPGRPGAALGDPRRGGSRLRAGDALDRPGPLPASRAGPGGVRAAGRDGHGARPAAGDVRRADRQPPGDPVDGRRLGGRDRGAALAGADAPPGRSTTASTPVSPSRWRSCTAG